MSKDPAFLYYDGDAARDVSHLNRLERGCYFDIMQAQRKFGRMSEDLIKKVLGKDFDSCWEQVKICLSCVEHMYFIGWLEDSSNKRKAYSESRSKNRSGSKSIQIPSTYVVHMENANENIKNTLTELGIYNGQQNYYAMVVVEMNNVWKQAKPDYPFMQEVDYPALLRIAYMIGQRKGLSEMKVVHTHESEIVKSFTKIANFLSSTEDKFYRKLTLDGIGIPKNFQKIEEAMRDSLTPQKNDVLEAKRITDKEYFDKD